MLMSVVSLPEPIRRFALLVVCVGMMGLLVGGCSDAGSSEANPDAEDDEPSLAVAAVEVVPRTLSQGVSTSNAVQAVRTVRAATPSTGVVRHVHVEEGDRVQEGDLLAELDVREERAELNRAQTILEREQAAYERQKRLREREFTSAQEYEAQRADRDVAASEVELWETRVALGEIRASTDGVITARNVEPGEAVSSNDDLLALADVSTLVVRVGISERQVPYLEEGQSVQVRLDAYPDETFSGSIRRIFPQADDDRQVRVEVALGEDARAYARPGFLARLDVSVDERANVFAVPAEALLGSEADDPSVLVIANGELERRSVEPSITRDGWTIIDAGLEQGEHVVASNPATLQPGTPVRISNLVPHPSDPDTTAAANQ